MAATAEGVNDPATIKALADEADGLADEITKAAGKIIKAAAEMKKKPEECKKPAETIMGLLTGISKFGKDLDDLAKKIGKAVAK